MHKMKRPCKCGHRAGKHGLVRYRVGGTIIKGGLEIPHGRSYLTTQTLMAKQARGACGIEGCICGKFKEVA